jgi:hypothetical protein
MPCVPASAAAAPAAFEALMLVAAGRGVCSLTHRLVAAPDGRLKLPQPHVGRTEIPAFFLCLPSSVPSASLTQCTASGLYAFPYSCAFQPLSLPRMRWAVARPATF